MLRSVVGKVLGGAVDGYLCTKPTRGRRLPSGVKPAESV